jgi:hypothetical protein
MDGTKELQIKLNKPDSERQISCFLSYAESRHFFSKEKGVETEGLLFWKKKGDQCKDEEGTK